jgi:hypothetical protein
LSSGTSSSGSRRRCASFFLGILGAQLRPRQRQIELVNKLQILRELLAQPLVLLLDRNRLSRPLDNDWKSCVDQFLRRFLSDVFIFQKGPRM